MRPARPFATICCVQHIVMCGQADRKIVQWDLNTRDVKQEYEQHLAAVNSLTFVDEGRRFVSSCALRLASCGA